MAQTDVSIYGNLLRPAPSLQDNLNSLDAADLQRTQLAGAKVNLIGQQQSLADQQAVRALYQQPDFNPTSSEGSAKLRAASPSTWLSTQKALLDNSKLQADTAKTTTETKGLDFDQAVKRKNQHLQQLVTVGDVPSAVSWINDAVSSGELPMQQAQQVVAGLQSGQIPLNDWKQKAMLGGLTSQQQLEATKPAYSWEKTGGALTPVQTNAYAGAVGPAAGIKSIPMTVSPDAQLQANTSAGNNRANITKDYALAGLDANGKDVGGGTGGLSPAAIENAATRYNVDGTLPPQLGRGTQGARDIRAIQNRAAVLSMGVDPSQLRVNQLDAKAASTALGQITKSATMAAAFENTANQNADLALSLSKKNDRTGIPMINAGLQAWRTGTGSPEATQFAAANETFVNEYAKIMSGGMGNAATSDSASKRAHELLSTGMTDGQYEGNVRLLQKEMRNRMKGYDDQTQALRTRIGGKGASPAAPASGGADSDLHAAADAILKGSK